ncbi:MAG: sulfotransferase [Phycisphaerae bacterium]|nr:sulfotransferase [Phycisphaerae bacterium]
MTDESAVEMSGGSSPDMSRFIFVTGFARGGTSWLRNCIAFHPDVSALPKEMVVFREYTDRNKIIDILSEEVRRIHRDGPRYVTKAPANAPFLGRACRMFPESKFLFILRDPRDVFISHKRSTRKWMSGANSRVWNCMRKIRWYYQGLLDSAGAKNVLAIRYEDLHQNFPATLDRIYRFLELPYDAKLLSHAQEKLNFHAVTGRRTEDRQATARKGVVGDWTHFLARYEACWFRFSHFWTMMMSRHEYNWSPPTYERILAAMAKAGGRSLVPSDRTDGRWDRNSLNILLLHHMDRLSNRRSIRNVIRTAEIDAKMGFASTFCFLPLDDPRYSAVPPAAIARMIQRLQKISSNFCFALHLGDQEQNGSVDASIANHPSFDTRQILARLDQQIDAYAGLGVTFRLGIDNEPTRRPSRVDSRASELLQAEWNSRGLVLFDTVVQPILNTAATTTVTLNDVGGELTVRNARDDGRVDDPNLYRRLPSGALVCFRTHPGISDVRRPICLTQRQYATA